MAPGGKAAGPPPAVKKLLGLFGSGREEDKMVGYLSFLKIGPKLLKFLPGGWAAWGGASWEGVLREAGLGRWASCIGRACPPAADPECRRRPACPAPQARRFVTCAPG